MATTEAGRDHPSLFAAAVRASGREGGAGIPQDDDGFNELAILTLVVGEIRQVSDRVKPASQRILFPTSESAPG